MKPNIPKSTVEALERVDATWGRPGLCDLEATVKPFRDGKGLSDEIA